MIFINIRCCYCPNRDGAIKKTGNNWAHIVCVELIPELRFENNGRKDKILVVSKPIRIKCPCNCCGDSSGLLIKVSSLK